MSEICGELRQSFLYLKSTFGIKLCPFSLVFTNADWTLYQNYNQLSCIDKLSCQRKKCHAFSKLLLIPSVCQQFASMNMAGQISSIHSQNGRKVDNEAVIPLTGPGKIQYLESAHMGHCTQFPLILQWEPCGSFIPGTDSCFFQALFLTVQLFILIPTSAEVVLRCLKPYSQLRPLGFLRLILRYTKEGSKNVQVRALPEGWSHHILTSFGRRKHGYVHGYHGML